jgi:diaminohydroxyphosphoribosylaminopyrimidine deaminase/5-amino-6-(5-phosphoribosylamino)uracil reductase
MFSEFDERMMRRAIELATLGRHTTQPNPCVGCVITQGERIVGEGWHRKWGEPHAEVLALQAAGEAARGATVYVTLEPHSYQSRTPPCTAALIRAGVSRVVSGVLDANPKVSGDGVRQLQAAGIVAEAGLLEDERPAQVQEEDPLHGRGAGGPPRRVPFQLQYLQPPGLVQREEPELRPVSPMRVGWA